MKRGAKRHLSGSMGPLSNLVYKYLFLFISFCIRIGAFILTFISQARLLISKVQARSQRMKPSFYMRIFLKPKSIFPRFLPSLFGGFTLKIQYFLLGCLVTLCVVFVMQSYYFVKSLPSPDNIGKVNYPLSTHIYDRNGKLLYEIYRDQNRTPVRLSELPEFVTQATVAIEDKDFYYHNGISIVSGILRALRETYTRHVIQGGSTITQQLVKSALLTPERTIQRKVKEIVLAIWTERLFSKNQILEMYLNQVPYGGSSYGIEEAATTYFSKHAKDLTISEAALLAGLPQAPSIYSPYINPDLAIQRRNEVLKKMYEQKYLSKAELIKSISEGIRITPPKTNIRAPHFVFYVKSILEKTYGIKTVEEGGLRVTTSLDLDIQEEAEKILSEEIDKIKSLQVTNGAVLVTRPNTGEILAMVGSTNYFDEGTGAFNATIALRQPGSSIKPLMYSLALEKGYTAGTIIDDTPVTFNSPGSPSYQPVNYDGRFRGKVPLRYALANSYNVPAVKVLNTIGVANFVNHATKMGIGTWGDSSRFGLSLTLGGGEVTMVDMAKAFGVFANQGFRRDIQPILKIEDQSGKSVFKMKPAQTKVLDEGVSFIISDILSDNTARSLAFGLRSALEIPGIKVAVKTGTTDIKKDNWTIGYTPNFLTAVWVGNNDGTPMNPALTSGVTGAAPIWNKMMGFVVKNYHGEKTWPQKPGNIVEKTCFFGRPEYFIKGTEGAVVCALPTLTPTPSK